MRNIQVTLFHVTLHHKLVLLSITTTDHQVVFAGYKPVELFKPMYLAQMWYCCHTLCLTNQPLVSCVQNKQMKKRSNYKHLLKIREGIWCAFWHTIHQLQSTPEQAVAGFSSQQLWKLYHEQLQSSLVWWHVVFSDQTSGVHLHVLIVLGPPPPAKNILQQVSISSHFQQLQVTRRNFRQGHLPLISTAWHHQDFCKASWTLDTLIER